MVCVYTAKKNRCRLGCLTVNFASIYKVKFAAFVNLRLCIAKNVTVSTYHNQSREYTQYMNEIQITEP